MLNAYIIRYAEIALKGKNRNIFENKLVSNIKKILNKNNKKYDKIKKQFGRIIVYSKENLNCLKQVFGIASFSPAMITQNLEKDALKFYTGGAFRVSTQTVTKNHPLNSMEINKKIGELIVKEHNAKVNLKNYDCEIGIEIISKEIFLFNQRTKGLGGLPVGVEGKVGILVEDETSLVSAFLLMKRGCKITLFGKDINYQILNKFDDIKFETDAPKNILAIAANDNLNTLKNYEHNQTILRPLVCKSKEEIEELLMFIKNV